MAPRDPERRLRCAAWNLRVGRKPSTVVGEVLDLLDGECLDVLTVCEAAAYIKPLRKHLRPHGYGVACYPHRDGSARDSAVIYRKGLPTGAKRLHRLGGIGWERGESRPGLHWPRSAVSKPVCGVRFVAVHLPPTPWARSLPKRGQAHDKALHRLRRLGKRWPRWVMAGDWNERPDVIGRRSAPSPAWLARVTDADLTGTRIDYVIARGVKVRHYHRTDHGTSDHAPILYTVVAR